jgi:hypothetical protein
MQLPVKYVPVHRESDITQSMAATSDATGAKPLIARARRMHRFLAASETQSLLKISNLAAQANKSDTPCQEEISDAWMAKYKS